MVNEELLYISTGEKIKGAVQGQLFGKPCFKIDGKAFMCFFQDCMVFKLAASYTEKALSLSGAKLFDPSGKGRPMKQWVQIPFTHKEQWEKFAIAAANHIKDKV